ncbi:unnamed protein product, partial [Arabidopsis halleri]
TKCQILSSGTTPKENNLKEIEREIALLVASIRVFTERKGALNTIHKILKRLVAHLKADSQFTVCTWFI